MANEKGLFDDLKVSEAKPEDVVYYWKKIIISLTEEQEKLLCATLPHTYPGSGFVDFGGAQRFGTAREFYEYARFEFTHQRREHKYLNVLEWLSLCHAWKKSGNEDARIFAGYVVLKILYPLHLQTLWAFADFGSVLTQKVEIELYESFISNLKNQSAISVLNREIQD